MSIRSVGVVDCAWKYPGCCGMILGAVDVAAGGGGTCTVTVVDVVVLDLVDVEVEGWKLSPLMLRFMDSVSWSMQSLVSCCRTREEWMKRLTQRGVVQSPYLCNVDEFLYQVDNVTGVLDVKAVKGFGQAGHGHDGGSHVTKCVFGDGQSQEGFCMLLDQLQVADPMEVAVLAEDSNQVLQEVVSRDGRQLPAEDL